MHNINITAATMSQMAPTAPAILKLRRRCYISGIAWVVLWCGIIWDYGFKGAAMILKMSLKSLPQVSELYRITRKTVWRTNDYRNLLIMVESGSCIFTLDNKDYAVGTNSAILIPAGQEYQRRPDGDLPCTFFYFHFILEGPVVPIDEAEAYSLLLAMKDEQEISIHSEEASLRSGKTGSMSHGKTALLLNPVVLDAPAFAMARSAVDEMLGRSVESDLKISLCLAQILASAYHNFLRQILYEGERRLGSDVPPRLVQAVLYIRQNFTKTISLKQLCSYCGISPQHLNRLFRKELNTTPICYINKLRILRARELFRKCPDLSCKEIAYELGFENPSYFSRLYTKVDGQPPSNFRRYLLNFKGADH